MFAMSSAMESLYKKPRTSTFLENFFLEFDLIANLKTLQKVADTTLSIAESS